MKNYFFILIFIIILFITGCKTNLTQDTTPSATTPTIPSTTTIPLNILKTDVSCKTDAECIFKEAAFCCIGNTKSFVQACFHINETPSDVDCSEVTVCPGFLVPAITDCKCVNNKCVGIS